MAGEITHKVLTKVDISYLLNELKDNEALWNKSIRTSYLGKNKSNHYSTQDIILRFSVSTDPTIVFADLDNIWFEDAFKLPQAMNMVYWLIQQTASDRIGRVVLTKLPPNEVISNHIDQGESVKYYQRFHICLQNKPKATWIFNNNPNQSFEPNPGDVYIIRNDIEHQVVNNSDSDRITMIIDLHTQYFNEFKKTI